MGKLSELMRRYVPLLFTRPRRLLRGAVLVILACTLASVAWMLSVPQTSVTVTMDVAGSVRFTDNTSSFAVPGDAVARFSTRDGRQRIALMVAYLPDAVDARGDRSTVNAYWSSRDRLSQILACGPVQMEVDGHRMMVTPRPRMLGSFTPAFWISLIAGGMAALVGLWIWTLRPLLWAPFMFALSGAGLFGGCVTLALISMGGLALSGVAGWSLMIGNAVSSLICAGALFALFARFPKPLIPRRIIAVHAMIHAVVAATIMFDLLPSAMDIILILAALDSFGIIVLIAWQTWRTRNEPDQRKLLMPIAIGTAIAIPLFLVLTLVGQFDGGRPIIAPEVTAPLFLLIYLGLGLSVVRMRLFALGGWALNLLMSAGAILLFLIIDPIVLATITRERDLALLIAAFVGIATYLPAREWLLRRGERLREAQMRDLLDQATQVALALSPDESKRAWNTAARLMFDPLEVETGAMRESGPQVREAGTALYVPSPGGHDALTLRYAAGGTRLFTPDDVAAAQRFATLVSKIVEAREAYLRGVTEERDRIARDLHDDVSARLLTSLHRTDPCAMQEDVRGAMADIRAIISGLSGDERTLDSLMADLRHETQNRLNAGGITLDWPLNAEPMDGAGQVGANHRHIISVVRETITNVLRHANATMVTVAVEVAQGQFSIAVHDNGIGLKPDHPYGNGLGNAARRMSEMGGTYAITGTQNGTSVHITIPLNS